MTAMRGVLDSATFEVAALPRFDDGTVNLLELVCTLAEGPVNQIVAGMSKDRIPAIAASLDSEVEELLS